MTAAQQALTVHLTQNHTSSSSSSSTALVQSSTADRLQDGCQQQPLPRSTRVSRYQKKHSHTHTLSLWPLYNIFKLTFSISNGRPMWGWWRWALVSPDGVAPSRMVSVSASVNLPLHHEVQKFSSGTSSPGWSRKKGRKTDVVWWFQWSIASSLHI